jgi:hypothetical protein
MALTQEEIDAFVQNGQHPMTALASAGEQMKKFADAFEQRGGAPIYGNDALEIVYLSNDFQAWLTPERLAVINRLRLDV